VSSVKNKKKSALFYRIKGSEVYICIIITRQKLEVELLVSWCRNETEVSSYMNCPSLC